MYRKNRYFSTISIRYDISHHYYLRYRYDTIYLITITYVFFFLAARIYRLGSTHSVFYIYGHKLTHNSFYISVLGAE